MAAKIKFSAAESAHYQFAMFLIQAQKKIASYRENNQTQKVDDPLSDLIICDHPLPKITKIIKKQERWSTRGFKALSLLQVKMNQTRVTQVWSNLKQQRKNFAKLNALQKNQHKQT